MQILRKRNQALRKDADKMKKDEVAKEEAIIEKLLLGQERQVRTKKVDSTKKDASLMKERTQVLI